MLVKDIKHILNKKKLMENIDNIIVNGIYNYFDDGKIRESRRSEVKIIEIIPFDKIDDRTLELWEEEVGDCDWLYANETDFFIKGELKICSDHLENIVFVRTVDDRWFSLGWWGGRLDADGSLTESL